MPQAILETERLLLEPLSAEHLCHTILLDADPEVTKYIESGRPLSQEEAESGHRERIAAADRILGLGYWAGSLKTTGEFVGWWSLSPPAATRIPQLTGNQAEIGYRLMPRWWKQGFAREASRELLRHGFEDLGLVRIFGETMAVNTASRSTMTSLGLQHVRTFHVHFDDPIPGTEHGEVEYAITREEWLAKS
jgi:RimJ/RimL family protein N-acetyltransferase